MPDLNDWSSTDNNNNDLFPEGQMINTFNDSGRAVQGALARFHRDISGNIISAGSGAAYTLASNRTFAALAAGMMFLFKAHVVCLSNPTLKIGSLAAKTLLRQSGGALAPGDIVADQMVLVAYVASEDKFRCIGIGDRELPDSYTTAGLPAASLAGRLAHVTDAVPHATLAVDTGTVWEILTRRMPTYTMTGGTPTRPAAATANKGLAILVSDTPEGFGIQVSTGAAWLQISGDILAAFTTAGLPTVGNAGRVVYDSTLKALQLDDGTNWRPLASQMPTYTVASLPSASGINARAWIYVSNAAGGATPAFSDGTNWRRPDRVIVT